MREPSDARTQGAPIATAIGATKDAAARRVLAVQEPEGIAGRDTITAVLVRSWNLYHGNTVPPSRRNFLERMVRLAAEDRPAVLCLQELPAWALPRLQGWSGMTVVADLAQRPMHNDEAVNAVKFDELWRTHRFAYDPNEYHGPTLYYFTLPVVWISGARDHVERSSAGLQQQSSEIAPNLRSPRISGD